MRAGLVHGPQRPLCGVVEDDSPDLVAVAFDDRVRAPQAPGFLGIERRVEYAVE